MPGVPCTQAILPALGFPPDALPDSGAALVGQLREAAGAGASGALAMHLTASCVVGPLWEEVGAVACGRDRAGLGATRNGEGEGRSPGGAG